jgi:hypothetical protein
VAPPRRPSVSTITSPGEALTWLAALVFTLSSFMGWYSAEGAGVTVSVIAWHTGTIGKLVFFVGLALIAFLFLRATGVEPPPAVRVGVVIMGVGVLATILVLVRLIDIPDRFVGSGRGIGIWISLVAALLIVVAGFLKAGEEV